MWISSYHQRRWDKEFPSFISFEPELFLTSRNKFVDQKWGGNEMFREESDGVRWRREGERIRELQSSAFWRAHRLHQQRGGSFEGKLQKASFKH